MNSPLEVMLRPYHPITPEDWTRALREVVQEVTLLGLWRAGFFEHAAFYGGTALRVFHGLDRFSEDLDFSLIDADAGARLRDVVASLRVELSAWGLSFEAVPKSAGETSGIESAFLKGNTRINLLNVGVPAELAQHFPHNQRITIKMELDTTPPPFASTEVKTRLLPTPHRVRLYDLPSLFAGKLHAVLYRAWRNRVKGRDFYDFVWYVARDIPVNLRHLEARIAQSTAMPPPSLDTHLDITELRRLLRDRFRRIDINAAADEVRPFLHDPHSLDLWNVDFFLELCDQVHAS